MPNTLQTYWKRIESKLPRKRAARIQLITFGVITFLAISVAPIVVLVNRSDVDIRQQAYTDPATGESCGWCAGPEQCFAATGHAPEAGSSAACAGGACCTGFSAGGGGGSGGGGGGTAPAAAKGVGANCVLGGSADPPEGCDGAGPLICAFCNDAMNKAGQSVCSFTEDGGSQHIAACGGLKGQTATGPAVCTVGQRSECGTDGCVGNQQRLCDAFGQWGPCVNSTQCGYTGANNGVACSQDIHCKSGFCDPGSKTCSSPQPSCYTAADECLSHNPQNCESSQSFTTYSACSVAVAPGCYVTDDECQSDNPQNCEDGGAFQSQADCQAALEAGQGGITPRCYVESDGCSSLTLANCQADDSHTTYAACSVNTLESCYTPNDRCQSFTAQNCEDSGSTTNFQSCRSTASVSSCTATCNRASGCFCPSGCDNTAVANGQQCSAPASTSTDTGGIDTTTPDTGTTDQQIGNLTSCTVTCSSADGCNCPGGCQNSFAQFGAQCGQPQTSGGGRQTSLIPDDPGARTRTQTPTPTPSPTSSLSQIANTVGQAGGSQSTSDQQTTTAPSSGLGIAPSLPPSQTATPTQGDQQLTTSGTSSLGLLLQPTTTPTSQLDAVLRDETPSAANQIAQVTPTPLSTGLTATPVETGDSQEETDAEEEPEQPRNPLQRAITAITGTTTTVTATATSPLNQLRNTIASTGVGRLFGITPTATEDTETQQASTQPAVISDEQTQLQTDIFDLEFQIYAKREECIAQLALDPQLQRFCEPEDLKEELDARITSDPICQQDQQACQQIKDELNARAKAVYITQANEAQASYLTRSCGAGSADPADIDFNCIKQVEDEVVALENEITAAMDEYCQGKEDEEACQDIRTDITSAVAVRVQETIDYQRTEEELTNAWVGERTVRFALAECEQLDTTSVEYQECIERWTLDSRIDNVQAVVDQARTGNCYNDQVCEQEAELIAAVETNLEELDTVIEFNTELTNNEKVIQATLAEMQSLNCVRYASAPRCIELQTIIDQAKTNIAAAQGEADTCGLPPRTGGRQASIDVTYSGLSNISCADLVAFSSNSTDSVTEYENVYVFESEIDDAAQRWLQAETYINLNCFREEVVDQVACDQAQAELDQAKNDFFNLSGEIDSCNDPNASNGIASCDHVRNIYATLNTQLEETSAALNDLSAQIDGHVNGRFVLDSMIDAAVNYDSRSFYCITNDYCLVVEPDGAGGYTSKALSFNDLVAEYQISTIRQDQLLGQTAFASAELDEEFDPNNPSHVLGFGQVVYHQWYQDDTRPAEICYEQQRADAGTNVSCAEFAAQTGFFYSREDDQYLKSCTSAGCEWVRISSGRQRDDESIQRRAAEILIFEEGYPGYDPNDHPSYRTWLDTQAACENEPPSASRDELCFLADRDYRRIRNDLVNEFLSEQSLTVNDASDILFRNDPDLTDEQKVVIGSYSQDFGGISYLGPQDDLTDPNYLYDRVEFNVNLGVRTDLFTTAIQTGCLSSSGSGDQSAGQAAAQFVGNCAGGLAIGTASLFSSTGISGARGITQGSIQTRGFFDQSAEAFVQGDITGGVERGLQGVYSGLNTARPVIALAGGPFGMVAAIADYDYAGAQTATIFADEGSVGNRLLAGVKTVGSLTGGIARPIDTFFYNTQTGQTLGGIINFGFNTITGDEQAAAESLFDVVEHGQQITAADVLLSGGLGLQTGIQGLSAFGLPNQVIRQGAGRVFLQEFVVEENLENVAGGVLEDIGQQYDIAQGNACAGNSVCFGQVGELFGNLFGGLIGGDIEQISNIDLPGSRNVGSSQIAASNVDVGNFGVDFSSSPIVGQNGFTTSLPTTPLLQVDNGNVTINNPSTFANGVNTVAYSGTDTVLVTGVDPSNNNAGSVNSGLSGVVNSVVNAPTRTVTGAQSVLQTAVTNANTIIDQLFGQPQLAPATVSVASNQTQRIGGPQNINNQASFFDLDVFNPDSSRFDPGLAGIVGPRSNISGALNINEPGTVDQSGSDALSDQQSPEVGPITPLQDLYAELEAEGGLQNYLETVVLYPDVTLTDYYIDTLATVEANAQVRAARVNRSFYRDLLDFDTDPTNPDAVNPEDYGISDQFRAALAYPVDTDSDSQNTKDGDPQNTGSFNMNDIRAQYDAKYGNPLSDLDSIARDAAAQRTAASIPVADTRTTTPTTTDTQLATPDDATNPSIDDSDTNAFADQDTTTGEDTNAFADQDTNPDATDPFTPDDTDGDGSQPTATVNQTAPSSSDTLVSAPTQLLADSNVVDTTQPSVVQTTTAVKTQAQLRAEFDALLQEHGVPIPEAQFPAAVGGTPSIDASTETNVGDVNVADATADSDSGTPIETQSTTDGDSDEFDTEPFTETDESTQLTETQSPTETQLKRPESLQELEEEAGPLALTQEDRELAFERSQLRRPPELDAAIRDSLAKTRIGTPTEPFVDSSQQALTEPTQITEPSVVPTPQRFISRVFSPAYFTQNMRFLGEAHRQIIEMARINNGNTLALRFAESFPVRFISNFTLHLYGAFSGLSAQELAENFWSMELNNGAYKSTRTANTELTSGKGNYDNVEGFDFNIGGDFNQVGSQVQIITADISSFFKTLINQAMPRVDYNAYSGSREVTFAVVQADGSLHIYQMNKQDVLALDTIRLTRKVTETLNGQPVAVIPAAAMSQLNQQILSGTLHYGKPITVNNVTQGNFITKRFNRPLVDQQSIDLLNQVQTMYDFNSAFILGKDANTSRVLPSAHHAVHISPNIPGTANGRNFTMQFNHALVNGVSARQDFFAGTTDTLINNGVATPRSEYHIDNNLDSNARAVRITMDQATFAQNDALRKQIKNKAKELGLDFGRGYGKYDPIHRALIRALSTVAGEKYVGHFLSAIGNNSEFIAPAIVVVGDTNTEAEALAASSQEKVSSFEGEGLVSMYGGLSQGIQNRSFFRNILNLIGKITFGPPTNMITGGKIIMFSIVPGFEGRNVGFSTAQSGSYGNGIVIGMVDNTAEGGTIEFRFDIGDDVSTEDASAIKDFLDNLDSEQFQQMMIDELNFELQALEAFEAQQAPN